MYSLPLEMPNANIFHPIAEATNANEIPNGTTIIPMRTKIWELSATKKWLACPTWAQNPVPPYLPPEITNLASAS